MADLSEGSLSDTEQKLTNLGLEEHSHRIGLQKSAFSFALATACLLLLAALCVVGSLLYLYATKDKFDWHSTLLLGAIVLPMTVIVVTTMRAAFRRLEPEANDGTAVPSWEALKDIVKEVAGMFKKDG